MEPNYIIGHIKLSNIYVSEFTKRKEMKWQKKYLKELWLYLPKYAEKHQPIETLSR